MPKALSTSLSLGGTEMSEKVHYIFVITIKLIHNKLSMKKWIRRELGTEKRLSRIFLVTGWITIVRVIVISAYCKTLLLNLRYYYFRNRVPVFLFLLLGLIYELTYPVRFIMLCMTAVIFVIALFFLQSFETRVSIAARHLALRLYGQLQTSLYEFRTRLKTKHLFRLE